MAAITFAVYGLIIIAFLSGRDWHPGALVHMGDRFLADGAVPGIPVATNADGYDGQFFYRLALDPLHLNDQLNPRLDMPAYRQQRILYPMLAYLISFGQSALVPYALVLVMLVSLAALGWAGAEIFRRTGEPAVYGFALSLYPGFVFSALHDLAEPLAAALLVSAMLAMRSNRPKQGGLMFTLAVLARETTIIVPVAVGICQLARGLNRQENKETFAYCALLPVCAYVLMQVALFAKWGMFGLTQGGGNLGAPLEGLALSIWALLTERSGFSAIFDGLMLVAFLFLLAMANGNLKSGKSLTYENLSLFLYIALALLFTERIWEYRGGFLRALYEIYILGTIAAVATPKYFRALLIFWALLFCGSVAGYLS